MSKIKPNERHIIGTWRVQDGSLVPDEACRRIESIISSGALELIARSEDGWRILYRNMEDGRLWELSYPEAESHGGGPPSLQYLSLEEASARYDIA